MGVRSFLKSKIEKHGGIGGAAVAAVSRPANWMRGGAGSRSAPPSKEASVEVLKEEFAGLPKEADREGFRAVGKADRVQKGRAGQYEVHGSAVAVFRDDAGKLWGVDNVCLHEDGPLGEATQTGNVIACQYHDWRSDITNGKCFTQPGRKLVCYPVKEKDGFVWIAPPAEKASLERGGEHDDGLKTV